MWLLWLTYTKDCVFVLWLEMEKPPCRAAFRKTFTSNGVRISLKEERTGSQTTTGIIPVRRPAVNNDSLDSSITI